MAEKSLDARWGNGFYHDWRGHYFSELHPAALDILTDYASRLESPWTDIKIAHLGAAVSRIPETAAAYGNRSARFGLVIQARWERDEESGVQIAWAKELWDRLAPYATGGAYANFLAADEPHRGEGRARSGKLWSTPRIEVPRRIPSTPALARVTRLRFTGSSIFKTVPGRDTMNLQRMVHIALTLVSAKGTTAVTQALA